MTVGRTRELDSLRGLLAHASRGEGRVALLVGEAGIGKSYLGAALATEAGAAGFDVRIGRCFPGEMQPAFAPFREALGDAVREGAALRRTKLGVHDARVRTFERVLEELRERTAARPVLLVVEDLHWADRDSLLLFLHVTRFGLGARLLLVGTLRAPDLDAASNAVLGAAVGELLREESCRRFDLRPLSVEEVGEVTASIAGGAVPQSLARALHAETSGNPLYVREIVRSLVEQGKLRVDSGRVSTDFAVAELGLPPSIRDVVRQRVARLSDGAAALARASAALGVPGDLGTLARAVDLDPDGALDALDQALASGILKTSGTCYEPVHAVVRRAIVEDLNPDRKLRLHRRLALALEASPGVDAADIAAQYAASRALPGAEAGVPHALAAAEAARVAGAHGQAAALLATAVELAAPLGDETVADLFLRLSVARAEALDVEGAVPAVEEALARLSRCAPTSSRERVAPALGAVAAALEAAGAPRAAYAPLVARGLVALGARRDLTWARLALLSREPLPLVEGPSYVSCFPGHDPDAVMLLRREGTEGDFAATVDPHDRRSPVETEALLARARALSDAAASIRVRDACARDRFFRGDFHAAIAEMDEVLALSERVGSLPGRVTAEVVLASSWAALGEFERARTIAAHAREAARRLGAMHRMNIVGQLAVETILGFFVGADFGRITAELCAFHGSPAAATTPFGIVALSLSLVGAAMAGDAKLVAGLVPIHVRVLSALPADTNEWGAGRDCGALALFYLGRADDAAAYRDFAHGSPMGGGIACFSSVEHTLARTHSLLGDVERAFAELAAARARYRETGRRPLLAVCDYDEALMLTRSGGAAPRVGELLDRALPEFEAFGMRPWIERVHALRMPGVRVNDQVRPDGLTEREVEVLRLLAGGMSNKEIAARLFISTATVERHVANVYAKIGLPAGGRGRVAAAAYARRHGLVDG